MTVFALVYSIVSLSSFYVVSHYFQYNDDLVIFRFKRMKK